MSKSIHIKRLGLAVLVVFILAGCIFYVIWPPRPSLVERNVYEGIGYREHHFKNLTYTVQQVIDGNTLRLTNGETVRLIGIDAPESKPNDKAKRDAKRTGQDLQTITKMGQEAHAFVEMGLDAVNDKVKLEFDVQDRDKYGRLLAYVYVYECTECAQDDKAPVFVKKYGDEYYYFLNALIVKEGYATPMTIPPNERYADLFVQLNQDARINKRGLWRHKEALLKLRKTIITNENSNKHRIEPNSSELEFFDIIPPNTELMVINEKLVDDIRWYKVKYKHDVGWISDKAIEKGTE